MRIAIVGAGPTGLAAANLLGQAGIETVLIERNAGLAEHPRAITIDDEGLRICQALGLAQEVCAHARLHVAAHYVSQQRYLVQVAPSQQPYGYPQISTFHQPTFEAILLQGLSRFPMVTTYFGETVTSVTQHATGVTLELQAAAGSYQTLNCDYLLACDGGRSPIRQQLGIHLQAPGLHIHSTRAARRRTQRWLVIDSIEKEQHSPTSAPIIFFCNPARPAVTVPTLKNGRRWEFMLKAHEHETQLLDAETIALLIQQASHSMPPDNQQLAQAHHAQITRKTVYTFHATVANTFAVGRIFLLGDAAHLMPPFGGQGMNSGLRDAYNLCWKLQLVMQGQAHPHLLNSYQQERRPHVNKMIRFSATLGALIMPTQRPLAQARDTVLLTLNRIAPLQHLLTEMGVKPQPTYPHGFRLPASVTTHHHCTGQLLPQPKVSTIQGETQLLDQFLGNHFCLLRLCATPEQAFTGVTARVWERLDTHYLCVLPQTHSASPGEKILIQDDKKLRGRVVIEHNGRLQRLLQHRQDVLLLLRPDHYIMGIFPLSKIAAVESALSGLLFPSETADRATARSPVPANHPVD